MARVEWFKITLRIWKKRFLTSKITERSGANGLGEVWLVRGNGAELLHFHGPVLEESGDRRALACGLGSSS